MQINFQLLYNLEKIILFFRTSISFLEEQKYELFYCIIKKKTGSSIRSTEQHIDIYIYSIDIYIYTYVYYRYVYVYLYIHYMSMCIYVYDAYIYTIYVYMMYISILYIFMYIFCLYACVCLLKRDWGPLPMQTSLAQNL